MTTKSNPTKTKRASQLDRKGNQLNKSLELPCAGSVGAKIFAPTADQRFLSGQDTFLRTHFPIQLHHRRLGQQNLTSEKQLLDRLLHPESSLVGNRVFILYGAAGSGKSELVRWLQTQISLQDKQRSTFTLRISRTELDIFRIAERFKQLSQAQPFSEFSRLRWEECRHKPRTLAKLLVLTALEQLLDSDETITAIYYQLIDIIQTNLEQCFAATTDPQTVSPDHFGSFIELFSREDLETIKRTSVIPIPIEYENLRHHLLKAFRDQLLESLALPSTLRVIAEQINLEHHLRPILLIDDLVQSINLFATDLLDYFITLEEGAWDVVIGITPSSLEATQRGKELLNRINYLDTIDDRVEKLWLSDEYGQHSSFLDESNCAEYARRYLSEYKRANGYSCSSICPSFDHCKHLDPTQSAELLSPFNQAVLVRLFRSLPASKGKVRYFNLYLREILERVNAGEELAKVIAHYVTSEQAVYHPEPQISQIYELFGPIQPLTSLTETSDSSKVTGEISEAISTTNISNLSYFNHLHQFFRLAEIDGNTSPPLIVSLEFSNPSLEQTVTFNKEKSNFNADPNPTQLANVPPIDPGKQAIKLWLQALNPVNKQLLRNLRRGTVKAIKDCFFLDTLTRRNTANPTRILRWAQLRFETVPPVQIEGVDDHKGLPLSRAIGPLAYILHDFADANGLLEQNLRAQLANHPNFPSLLFNGQDYQNKIKQNLENLLGCQLEELAWSLLFLVAGLGRRPQEIPPIVEQALKLDGSSENVLKYPEPLEFRRPRLSNAQLGIIRRLFDDCFKLRENVYDGLLLEKIISKFNSQEVIQLLQRINPHVIESDFRLNDIPLGTVLEELLNELTRIEELRTDQRAHSILINVVQSMLPAQPLSLAEEKLSQLLFSSSPYNIPSLPNAVTTFLSRCDSFELHHLFCLARLVQEAQNERSLVELRQLQAIIKDKKVIPKNLSITFSYNELDLLANFGEPHFNLSLSQLSPDLLKRIAKHLPSLYWQLEVRLKSSI